MEHRLSTYELLSNPSFFSELLYKKMKRVNHGIRDLELYEFRYGLDNLQPAQGDWTSIQLKSLVEIEQQVNDIHFYQNIQLKPRVEERIVLDPTIISLTCMLFVGLVTGEYPIQWVRRNFYFDIRGFYFLHRTQYFNEEIIKHLNGHPYRQYKPRQKKFERFLEIGYQNFKFANEEVDTLFTQCVRKIIAKKGTPILLAIAGPTAAGKTEIVSRLCSQFAQEGMKISAIEMDNFLTDRDYREAQGIDTRGKEALHFKLLQQSLTAICAGQKITIPRYDFIYATSSHDLAGNLKPGKLPLEIDPADIIFIEGNYPFLLPEIAPLITIKVVYLTDDSIRLKRKWRRDIDIRKKYEPTYFRNRYFKDQFIMAQIAYIPQMEVCDLLIDTTGAAFWMTAQMTNLLNYEE
jgi:uridine kinase